MLRKWSSAPFMFKSSADLAKDIQSRRPFATLTSRGRISLHLTHAYQFLDIKVNPKSFGQEALKCGLVNDYVPNCFESFPALLLLLQKLPPPRDVASVEFS